MALLTDARASVWNAVKNWKGINNDWPTPLINKFARYYDYNDDMHILTDAEPAIIDFPALSIFPSAATPEPHTHQTSQYPYALSVVIWTPSWRLTKAEALWEDLIDAFWKATASGLYVQNQTVSYVKDATGHHPWRLGQIVTERVKLGKDQNIKAVRKTFDLVLRLSFNPFQ